MRARSAVDLPPRRAAVHCILTDECQPAICVCTTFSPPDPPDTLSLSLSLTRGVLHNFGGNTGMWGSAESLNTGPFDAFANASSVRHPGLKLNIPP